jgi:hypothetical protein
MRFKTGFFLGCAAGAWAASKASHLKRGDNVQADSPSWRAEHVSSDAGAERVRALGDLARERFNSLLDSPLGEMARDRLTEVVGSSTGRGNGRDSASQRPRSS